ncbi:hypothetical protein [Clostridium sp.]|uniref:hypothetical protein n=1 Tax=Clostridium sp. TaxID=1506 RepID=UPI00263A0737|nr:hypothetical protein [Clostridium sp.]
MNIDNQFEIVKKEVFDFNEEIRNTSNDINYNKFIEIIDLLGKFIKDISIDEKYEIDNEKVNSILNETLEAFNNKDFILVTDLLEYELLEEMKF